MNDVSNTDTIPRLLLAGTDIGTQATRTQELLTLKSLLEKQPAGWTYTAPEFEPEMSEDDEIEAITPISAPPVPEAIESPEAEPSSSELDTQIIETAEQIVRDQVVAARDLRRGRHRRPSLSRIKAFYAAAGVGNLAFGLAVNLIPNSQHIAQVIGLASLALGGACVTALIEITRKAR